MRNARSCFLLCAGILCVALLTALGFFANPLIARSFEGDPPTDLATRAGVRPGLPPSLRLVAPARTASMATIDFEDFDLASGLFLDTPEAIAFPNASGSGVSVTLTGHDDVRIYDLIRFGGGDYATGRQACIDMNWVTFSNPLGTDIVFDRPADSFILTAGDYGSDDDSPLTVTGFDVSGNPIAFDFKPWPASQYPPFTELSLSAPGICRVHYSSGGTYPNSTFIDLLSFGSAPTPVMRTTWGRVKSAYR